MWRAPNRSCVLRRLQVCEPSRCVRACAHARAERTTDLNRIFNWEDFTCFFSVVQVNIFLEMKSRACSKSAFILPSGIGLLFIVISGP